MPRAGDSDVRRWIERYFNDCVCSVRGELSFGLGMISLFCWGIAEVPQIITNFHNKSGHGVSLAFLLTWVVGSVPLHYFKQQFKQNLRRTSPANSLHFLSSGLQ
ncbi:hypothetical protein BHE74_00020381 [Ensete ventricosum]|nr:hypothetical protein BHE74_00020381 [Ensete ventricosum]